MALLKHGNHAEACPKLKRSQAIHSRIVTKYRLAECYASVGHIGRAYSLFLDVAKDARGAGQADEEAWARKRADELKPRVPMLIIAVSGELKGLAALRIEVDGDPTVPTQWNKPVPVDPGERVIRASASGMQPWQHSIRALGGAMLKVDVPALKAEQPMPPPATSTTATESGVGPSVVLATRPGGSLDGYRIGAIVAGAVGLASIGAGAALGSAAFSKWDEALSHCMNRDPNNCDAKGIALGTDMRTLAGFSTASFIMGGMGLATGALLLIFPPRSRDLAKDKSRVTVMPVVGQHGMMTILQSRF